MSTVAYVQMKELARGIEKIFPSAVCSGIVGDRRHQARGGYHIGRRFQPGANYSVIRPDDRDGQGPDDGASAVDITMNRRDMILATQRIHRAYSDPHDPRRKYLNAVNGWTGVGPAIRLDFYARKKKTATADHKWHMHLEQRRRYILDRTANEACFSILRGDTVRTWLTQCGIRETPSPGPRKATARVATAPPYPGRILRRNDHARVPDPAVRQWQTRMRERGWTSIGKADGLPGRKFETVVRAWQKTIKLPVDGTVGPATWPTPWTRPVAGG